MRNLVLVLVALLAVPAFAAPALQLVNLGSNNVALDFTTSGSLVSGMGLKITVTDSAVISNYADGAQGTKYWVHPSNILIDGTTVTKGSAVVSNDANGMVLEYGALYVRSNPSDPNKPATSGRLCTFTVSKACTVTVTGDYAGGVVTEDFNSFAPTAQLVIPADECLKSTAPYYAKWVEYGKPNCWCFRKQCKGDADGAKTFLKPVMLPDFNAFMAAYNKSKADVKLITNGICADFDKADTFLKPVMLPDFNIFMANYNKADSLVTECDGTYINFWKN